MKRIELFQGQGDQWYFRFVAANGEIVATSEGYHNSQDAMDAALLVRDGFHGAEVRTREGS